MKLAFIDNPYNMKSSDLREILQNPNVNGQCKMDIVLELQEREKLMNENWNELLEDMI